MTKRTENIPFRVRLFNVPDLDALEPGQTVSCQDSDGWPHEATILEISEDWARQITVRIKGLRLDNGYITVDPDAVLVNQFIIHDGKACNGYWIKRRVDGPVPEKART